MSLSGKLLKSIYSITGSIKILIKNHLPEGILVILRAILDKFVRRNFEKNFVNQWKEARKKHPSFSASTSYRSGVNIVGYFRTVKGISEAARSSALALEAATIPFSTIDYNFGIPVSQQRLSSSLVEKHDQGFLFNTNLFHINPPQLPYLWSHFNKDSLTGRYSIGVWYWELPVFPDDWRFAFDLVDEVWVATQFIFDSVSAKSNVPVVKVPPCVKTAYDDSLTRSDYHMPSDRFLFLCAYDMLSVQTRKNPLGAVEAFKRAFGRNDSTVGLILKVNNATENPQGMKQLYEYIKGYSNCYIIDEVFNKTKFDTLIHLVDAYVSLHRSEGFGLIPAEAMSFGKPVIMTQWSGNVDFMTADNSCGVGYKLIPVEEGAGPYTPGQLWADPDVEQAAYFMQKLYSDRAFYNYIASQASKTIDEKFSPINVGLLMENRLKQLGLLSQVNVTEFTNRNNYK